MGRIASLINWDTKYGKLKKTWFRSEKRHISENLANRNHKWNRQFDLMEITQITFHCLFKCLKWIQKFYHGIKSWGRLYFDHLNQKSETTFSKMIGTMELDHQDPCSVNLDHTHTLIADLLASRNRGFWLVESSTNESSPARARRDRAVTLLQNLITATSSLVKISNEVKNECDGVVQVFAAYHRYSEK